MGYLPSIGWYIVMGYLPSWSHCNGLPTQLVYCNGLPPRWYIVMGYLPRWSHCNGLPAQMVYCNGLPAQMVTL